MDRWEILTRRFGLICVAGFIGFFGFGKLFEFMLIDPNRVIFRPVPQEAPKEIAAQPTNSRPIGRAPERNAASPTARMRGVSPRRPRFPILIRRAFTMPMGAAVLNMNDGSCVGADASAEAWAAR